MIINTENKSSGLFFYQIEVNTPTMKKREFGGSEKGDDQAALLNPDSKPLTQIVQDDSFREFEFRQYLFACQCKVHGFINFWLFASIHLHLFFF